MGNCIDFAEDNKLLQSKALEICDRGGQSFPDSSPKFHCELAGEGIEYDWVCAKNYYQGLTKSKNKGNYNFRNSVT